MVERCVSPADSDDSEPGGLGPCRCGMPVEKDVCVVFLRFAGEAGERLPLGKSEQFCAYLLFVGALAARLSDG